MAFVWIVAGLALLVLGAEVLIRSASTLAGRLGISPLVVGLTVVAYGTSAPEVAVGVNAAMTGRADLAVGNVVGSNTFNVLFILGLAALITPMTASRQLIRFDVPVMIGVSGLAWGLAADGRVGRIEGAALAALGVAYTVALLVIGRRDHAASAERPAASGAAARRLPAWLLVAGIAAGLAVLVLGSRWLVGGSVSIARGLGVDELVIGLTIVAAGTSMPEVATSVMAAIRGRRDLAIGNVVGSNVFNLLLVLGGAAAIAPQGVPVADAAVAFDLPVMTAVAVACLPIFFTGGRVVRWEAGLFLGYYAAYAAWLVLAATDHAAAKPFGRAMLGFVVPMTVLGLAVSFFTARCRRSIAHG